MITRCFKMILTLVSNTSAPLAKTLIAHFGLATLDISPGSSIPRQTENAIFLLNNAPICRLDEPSCT